MFRRMLAGRPPALEKTLLNLLGFTWGVNTCSIAIGTYIVCAFLIGWFLTWYVAKGL